MLSENLDQERLEEEVFILPASFAQQRLWFIEQLLPGNTLYVIPLVFRLTGLLRRSALHHSLNAIVQRHEILRTTFEPVEGQLMQVIAPELPVLLSLTDLRSIPLQTREAVALAQIWQRIQQPFHLHQGPLFRTHLWQVQDQEHLLLLALHHIIFDEWSSGIFIRELGELYTAQIKGQSIGLPELPIQYADFAHWQRQWLQGETLNAQIRYWKKQLQAVSWLNLPGASRALTHHHQGASQLLELPQSLLEALEALSQQAGVTLFMTLLAAFQVLLHRYTGQTDIAIGSPIANRHHSQLEGLIGFLVNTLVLRTDLAGDPTFRVLLERVREVTLAAYAHQDLPFEKLVEELQPFRSLGQNPLFQVVFALQNTPMTQLELPGLVLNPVELETKTARFHLELYVWKCADNFRSLWGKGWQRSDGLRGVVVYNTDLWDAPAITALCQHWQTLLAGIVANPDTSLSALPLLTLETKQALLQHWYNQPTSTLTDVGIHQRFEAQAQQQPEAIAVQFGPRSFTYQALNQGSNQLARYLQRLGVGRETPVGICLERGVEAIAAMLAVLKAGGLYVPLDPNYPSERLRWMLADAGITVVLTQTDWADTLQVPGTTVICLEQAWKTIAAESDANLAIAVTGNQLAYLIYTSGSTGTPKGVMVPHEAVSRLVCETNYIHITPSDRMAQVANLAFDAATFEVWGALLNGAQLIGLDRETTLTPAALAIALQQQQISILFLTTALFNQTASQNPAAFQSLQYVLFGGECANVDCVRAVVEQGKPQHLIHVYGPTENTTFSTWYEVQVVPENATTIPIGQAIANTQVYLLDPDLQPVPAGVLGEIYLGGMGLARGYWQQPELTAKQFIELPLPNLEGNALHTPPSHPTTTRLYKTGDRARYHANGDLEFWGRTDDQVKIRGFRVELGEIELAIKQHPAIQTAVVVIHEIRDQAAGVLQDHQLVAYIVPKTPNIPSERTLRSFLKQTLPAYMLPSVFVVVLTLPLTANGKVDQKALPPPHLTMTRDVTSRMPTTSLETSLAELWQQLLGRKSVGIHDSFFELGGHSLLATQLISRIRDRFQLELPLRLIFERPTIAELADQIERLRQNAQSVDNRASDGRTESELPQREEIEL